MHATPKFLAMMEMDLYGRRPFLRCPMSKATTFIQSLSDNSLFFIQQPIISLAAMASGDMEGFEPISQK